MSLQFYRAAWRESIRCKDYSTKHFIRRKLREHFRSSGTFVAAEANTELEQIKRVVSMSNMYASDSMKSVLEKQ
jgi:hypothetical protein